MTKAEAELLANHIARWSANDQVKNHKEGLNPEVRSIGDGDIYVVVLKGRFNYHVWSWIDWGMTFEHDLVIPQEESEVEA